MSALLEISNLAVNYGSIKAIKGISLDVEEGGITALVGANGAGKSTTLDAISGLVGKRGGRVLFAGKDITRLKPHKIVAAGIVHVPEGRAILAQMTVRENLMLGAYRRGHVRIDGELEYVFSLFPRLRERINGVAGNLSGGEQQMLAIGRALMAKPKLLLMDEPSMGLAPVVVKDIFRVIRQISKTGLTIFLVEQNVHLALKIAQHGYVLETGNLVFSGTGAELLHHPRVMEAYLGA